MRRRRHYWSGIYGIYGMPEVRKIAQEGAFRYLGLFGLVPPTILAPEISNTGSMHGPIQYANQINCNHSIGLGLL